MTLGASPGADGTRFRVLAPQARAVELLLEPGARGGAERRALRREPDGTFAATFADVAAGDRYRYLVDGAGPFPDPASRFQPEGVHGPSEVIDAARFAWTARDWRGIARDELVIYELHVGAFTPAGTFDGVRGRLSLLRELGVTAIELMPVADFPGARNWGYDGVSLFAPARCYGRPDDLRRLVDAAHAAGLGVLLDVVYNHLGPDGNYLGAFGSGWWSRRHKTPWGDAFDFDGEHAPQVRRFFVENALHWLRDYRFDGLRLDATHAIVDEGPRHFLAELAARVAGLEDGPRRILIAEDHRNLARLVQPDAAGGFGLDGVWADDFHHEARRLLAGDRDGYFGDYRGTTADLATTLRRGWLYCGGFSRHQQAPRGTDPAGVPPRRFVICLQNHDQVGNRALGERLHHQIDAAAWRAAVVLLLCAPQTPLLFMGQEWGASTPFLYFTDHHEELGRQVTEGRRGEFREFEAFADPERRARIPDPQALSTFLASRLRWDERAHEPHAAILRLHRRLLELRRGEPALRDASGAGTFVVAPDDGTIVLRRAAPGAPALLVAVRLRGAGTIDLAGCAELDLAAPWRAELVLSTEAGEFCADPAASGVEPGAGAPRLSFARPGALVLRELAADAGARR